MHYSIFQSQVILYYTRAWFWIRDLPIISRQVFKISNNNIPSVSPQVGSGEGGMYSRPYPYLAVERLFWTDPWLKKNVAKTVSVLDQPWTKLSNHQFYLAGCKLQSVKIHVIFWDISFLGSHKWDVFAKTDSPCSTKREKKSCILLLQLVLEIRA